MCVQGFINKQNQSKFLLFYFILSSDRDVCKAEVHNGGVEVFFSPGYWRSIFYQNTKTPLCRLHIVLIKDQYELLI